MTSYRKDVPALGRREWSLRLDLRRLAALRFLQRAGAAYRRGEIEDAQKRALARIADSIAPWLTALITILASLAFACRQ